MVRNVHCQIPLIGLNINLQEFMMELTQHQGRVGSVLQEGNQLISDGSLTSDAEAEVPFFKDFLRQRHAQSATKLLGVHGVLNLWHIRLELIVIFLSGSVSNVVIKRQMGRITRRGHVEADATAATVDAITTGTVRSTC